jgi:hypothetical protein
MFEEKDAGDGCEALGCLLLILIVINLFPPLWPVSGPVTFIVIGLLGKEIVQGFSDND